MESVRKSIERYKITGFVLLAIVFLSYFIFHFPSKLPISPDNQDWANLGAYVGGVAGPCCLSLR